MGLEGGEFGLGRKVKRHLARLHVTEFGHLMGRAGRPQQRALIQVIVEVRMFQDFLARVGRSHRQPVGDEVQNVAIVADAFRMAPGPQIENGSEDGAKSLVQPCRNRIRRRVRRQRCACRPDDRDIAQLFVGSGPLQQILLRRKRAKVSFHVGRNLLHVADARGANLLAQGFAEPMPLGPCRPEDPSGVRRFQTRLRRLAVLRPGAQCLEVARGVACVLLLSEPLRRPTQGVHALLQFP